jgi:hypothetical protein
MSKEKTLRRGESRGSSSVSSLRELLTLVESVLRVVRATDPVRQV